MKKYYAYIKFELTSPLAVGSGKAFETDKDVIKNSKGEPYIPASALAGVYSTLFDEDKEKYFGDVNISTGKSTESSIITYDAVLCDGSSYDIGIRNGVGLDKFKVAKEGAKFDFEIVEPGATFWTAVEYTSYDEDSYAIDKIMSAWKDNSISFGAKTMRGLGTFQVIEQKYVVFDIKTQLNEWLEFDIYNGKSISKMPDWDNYTALGKKCNTISLTIDQASPVTVRVYTTEVSEGDKTAADYSQLVYRKNSGGDNIEVAVIPGTSWAGTFRHNMIKYGVNEKDMEKVFGCVSEREGASAKSKIYFSESYFENGESKVVSRNAIDRFSGGASDTSLFTEKMYMGGKGAKLNIGIPMDIDPTTLKALVYSIADLNEGFLTAGGEASIGHGLFRVTEASVNDEKISNVNSSADLYNGIMDCIGGMSNE